MALLRTRRCRRPHFIQKIKTRKISFRTREEPSPRIPTLSLGEALMSVIKRARSTTHKDLIEALDRFLPLLEGQDEDEAVTELSACKQQLETGSPDEQQAALGRVVESFDGDLELIAYTFQREGDQWTEVEELSHVSSRVLSLARRLLR